MSSMISLMVLDVADNQLHEVPDELFLHTKAMPGFVLITSGNALDTKGTLRSSFAFVLLRSLSLF